MNKRLCVILMLLMACLQCLAGAVYNTDSLLNVLDAVIDSTACYEGRLHSRLGKYRAEYESASDLSLKMRVSSCLFMQYRRFRVDSAMYYALERVKMARQMGNADSIAVSRINEADAMKRLGRFADAKSILDALAHNEFLRHNRYYYEVCFSTINAMVKTAISEEERMAMKELCCAYRDSVGMVNADNDFDVRINKAEVLKRDGRIDEALQVLLEAGRIYQNEIKHDAIYWAVLAETYAEKGNLEGTKYGYTMSAIIDKQSCNKTYTSLQNLAALLFKEGDTDRAYRYITLSMSDVKEAHALSRLSLVGEYLPIITTAYDKKQHTAAVHRVQLIVLISVVAMVLGLLLLLLVRRTRKLTALRQQLAENNEKLTQLNGALEGMNKELHESNIIKEVYIAQLFNLCSNYIGQMENYRTALISKLKSGRIKEVEKTLAQETTNSQLKSLFKSFDQVFLEIFPNFIENFNSLLKPEERIYPKSGELLSPELRIYALVRLGINDSTKIAEFLHYSVQTVYNYRQKTRNKAIRSRQEFTERVKTI